MNKYTIHFIVFITLFLLVSYMECAEAQQHGTEYFELISPVEGQDKQIIIQYVDDTIALTLIDGENRYFYDVDWTHSGDGIISFKRVGKFEWITHHYINDSHFIVDENGKGVKYSYRKISN